MTQKKNARCLLLFDWDNTLVDTWQLVHESLQVALRAFGLREWDIAESKQRLGASLRDNFPKLFGEHALKARHLYREHFLSRHLQELQAFDKAEPLLRALSLHRERCVMGIVSNKGGDALRAEIAHLGWQEYFRAVVGAEDVARDKPDPCCLEEIFVQTGTTRGDFSSLVYVGDSVVDTEFASRCAMTAIIVGEQIPAPLAAPLGGRARAGTEGGGIEERGGGPQNFRVPDLPALQELLTELLDL